MMPQTPPTRDDLPPAVELDAYMLAFVNAFTANMPSQPKIVQAEHLVELDADAPTVVLSLASLTYSQSGPWLEAVATLEALCLTNRGRSTEGLYDCYVLVNEAIGVMHEARWGLGGAVDPCAFENALPDPVGANTDNFYSWRVSCLQRVRLPAPLTRDDDLAQIIDVSIVDEVWLGFDPDIGLSHIDDYVLVAKRAQT